MNDRQMCPLHLQCFHFEGNGKDAKKVNTHAKDIVLPVIWLDTGSTVYKIIKK